MTSNQQSAGMEGKSNGIFVLLIAEERILKSYYRLKDGPYAEQ
jgi:hypothetical protein